MECIYTPRHSRVTTAVLRLHAVRMKRMEVSYISLLFRALRVSNRVNRLSVDCRRVIYLSLWLCSHLVTSICSSISLSIPLSPSLWTCLYLSISLYWSVLLSMSLSLSHPTYVYLRPCLFPAYLSIPTSSSLRLFIYLSIAIYSSLDIYLYLSISIYIHIWVLASLSSWSLGRRRLFGRGEKSTACLVVWSLQVEGGNVPSMFFSICRPINLSIAQEDSPSSARCV